MTDTELVITLISGGVISIFLLACLLTMLPGFICWAIGKKETGDKLVKFGAICGVIVFSLLIVAAAWSKRSWLPLIILAAVWLILPYIKKKRKLIDKHKQ